MLGPLAASLVPACATVPRRAQVVQLASQILDCPPDAIAVRVGTLDQVCAERVRGLDGRLGSGPCLAWMPLEISEQGWIVEGCGHVDRYAAHPCTPEGSPLPAEFAFDGTIQCDTY